MEPQFPQHHTSVDRKPEACLTAAQDRLTKKMTLSHPSHTRSGPHPQGRVNLGTQPDPPIPVSLSPPHRPLMRNSAVTRLAVQTPSQEPPPSKTQNLAKMAAVTWLGQNCKIKVNVLAEIVACKRWDTCIIWIRVLFFFSQRRWKKRVRCMFGIGLGVGFKGGQGLVSEVAMYGRR